jgi:hypothetical protein
MIFKITVLCILIFAFRITFNSKLPAIFHASQPTEESNILLLDTWMGDRCGTQVADGVLLHSVVLTRVVPILAQLSPMRH